MDKIFVLDNFNIVLDKKYFVRADGRGISPSIFAKLPLRKTFPSSICPDKTFFVLDKSEIVLDKNFVQG